MEVICEKSDYCLNDIWKYIIYKLSPIYQENESNSLAKIIFAFFNFDFKDYLLKKNELFPKNYIIELNKIINRLLKFEPIQYIIGHTYFLDFKINVNKNVLIPRPETELLVNLINKTESGILNIIDICTGSGVIAICLASNKNFNLTATDVSFNALKIAKENAILNKSNINFFHYDITNFNSDNYDLYDVIVSNPPYISPNEKKEVSKNVFFYEPHIALFTPNNNPIFFYEKIIDFSNKYLKPFGRIYFEINPIYCNNIIKIIEENFHYEIINDFSNKQRFLKLNRKF